MLSLIWRVPASILLTTVAASVIGAVFLIALFALADPSMRTSNIVSPITLIGLFLMGFALAIVPASILGVCFELPLAFNRHYSKVSLLAHIALSSTVGSCLMMAIWKTEPDPFGRHEGFLVVAILGALGGVCSALAWSKLIFNHQF
jgi:hypothetical protein